MFFICVEQKLIEPITSPTLLPQPVHISGVSLSQHWLKVTCMTSMKTAVTFGSRNQTPWSLCWTMMEAHCRSLLNLHVIFDLYTHSMNLKTAGPLWIG